jgi:hypothetical protein
LIVNPTDEFLAESLSLLDSDEGLKIESKSSSKKIFINKNLLGDYVLLVTYYYPTNNIYPFLNCNRNYTDNREYINRGITYLKTIPEVLELIHSEFEEIRVNEY